MSSGLHYFRIILKLTICLEENLSLSIQNIFILTCMSYRWREPFNTVRFVTSSQRGLTCVGAECRKEGGGDGPYIRRGAD